MRDALGSLDRVDYIVKLLGMVNAVPNFNDSPKVINGCSDLFVEVFGDAGRHARSAVGHAMLPNQISETRRNMIELLQGRLQPRPDSCDRQRSGAITWCPSSA